MNQIPRRMKASWQRAGFATGQIRCEVRLPALDLEFDRRCNWTDHPLTEARRFILKRLPSAPTALEGATFTIRAEFRAIGRGVRWAILSW